MKDYIRHCLARILAVLRYRWLGLVLLAPGFSGCSSDEPRVQQSMRGGGVDQTSPQLDKPRPLSELDTIPEQPQVNPNHSMGTGGAIGAIELSFRASNGLSSNYRTIIPEDIGEKKAYGLNIHLHGDGGGDYNWLYRPNVTIARRYDLIGVVVQAPNRQRRWYNQGRENAAFLHELISQEFFANYNIDQSRVYFSGVSGGAQFLSGQFIPLYGHHYNSGALMLCGGPSNWQRRLNGDASFRQRFKLFWYSGTADFLYSQIVSGITYYKNAGFQVDSKMIEGGRHCRFPGGVAGALERKLPRILQQ